MSLFLIIVFFFSATVFYDRPPKRFKTAEVDVKHKVLMCTFAAAIVVGYTYFHSSF